MGLKSPAEYVHSLRDGRVTFWDGERIDDITAHPRFKMPVANTTADRAYDDPEPGGVGSARQAALGVRPARTR